MSKTEQKILVIGIPYFARKLAKNLQELNSDVSFIALDTSKTFLDKIRYVYHIWSAKTIYQIGGNAYLGGALRFAYLLRKRLVFHWVGTDVLMAQGNFKNHTANIKFLEYVEHLCEVHWIQEELNELGIFPQIMQIACIDQIDNLPTSFPEQFSILTYMTPGREEFYGLSKIVALAEQFPNIKIRIVGISTYHSKLPSNIEIRGWVSDMKKEYLDSCLYLRLPEHDGLSFSVLEAMSLGRYVGYSQRLEGTEQVTDFDSLIKLIISLKEKHSLGELSLNFEGINFVKNNFQKDSVLKELKKYLTQVK
jgi:hypothetical protein